MDPKEVTHQALWLYMKLPSTEILQAFSLLHLYLSAPRMYNVRSQIARTGTSRPSQNGCAAVRLALASTDACGVSKGLEKMGSSEASKRLKGSDQTCTCKSLSSASSDERKPLLCRLCVWCFDKRCLSYYWIQQTLYSSHKYQLQQSSLMCRAPNLSAHILCHVLGYAWMQVGDRCDHEVKD